jgi:hypothetical protein
MGAVVVYRIFWLSLDALFALFRISVTVAIIITIFTLRIPSKRKYHQCGVSGHAAGNWGAMRR